MSNNNYDILIQKLDSFIKKYYQNQVIRGVLLLILICALFSFFSAVSEYFGHFSISIRTTVFYTFLALFTSAFIKLILIPLLQYFRIGKVINHKQAATILATHFNELQDKLHNTLELADNNLLQIFSRDLVIASINQKIAEIKPIPFNTAINFKKNVRYLQYLLALSGSIVVIFIFWPSVLTEGSKRIINHNTYFEPATPFEFMLLNDTLSVQKGSDFLIKLEIRGKYVPENVSIAFGNNNFQMNKISKSKFEYSFKNINNPLEFWFQAETYSSRKYLLQVLPAPTIIDFSIAVEVPEYTKDSNRVYHNVGDITAPCGSKIKWNFNTKDIDSLHVLFNDTIKLSAQKNNDGFSLSKLFLLGCNYKIAVKNKFFRTNQLVKYNINIIPDLAPSIKVNTIKDSTKFSAYYFNGLINDDYGFSKLTFNVRLMNGETEDAKDSVFSTFVPINKSTTSQEFYYAFDFSALNAKNSRKVSYYFEVWDNDAVNGSKSARSTVFEFIVPTKDEMQKMQDESAKNMQEKLAESMKLGKDLKKDIDLLQESLINKNMSSWDKTKMMEQLTSKQNRLEELSMEISKEFKKSNEFVNNLSDKEKELLEKQKQMQELLDNVMTDELKKMMDDLNKLMQEFDKNKINQATQDMKMSYEDMNKQLDRNMELLKKYELEKKIENTIDRLDKLAEEHENLSEKTSEKGAEKEKLAEQQKKQADEFNKITEEYKEIQDKNKELKTPMKMEDMQEEANDIKKDMKESSQQMQENKMDKASKKQKETAKKMKQMADNMKQQNQQNQQQQQQEDYDSLRKILENLVTFSFDQEELMKELKEIQPKNPKYLDIVSKQKNLSDNYKVIKDSLNALAKRTPKVSSMINREQTSISKYMDKTLDGLGERNVPQAKTSQQFVMTSANNLALLLAESLDQMQEPSNCNSSGQCSKPKKKPNGKKKSLESMKSQQESLKGQMEKMMEQLKKGNKDGKFDPNATNKKLSQMLAQQEIFQQQMSDMMKNATFSPQAQKSLNEIKALTDKNATDLINKNITPETLKRQNLIVTRLLEAENAEFQRETDTKRESKEAKDEKFSNPEQFFKYKGVNSKFNEMINTSSIKLYKYYKNIYKEYLIKLNEN